MNTGFVYNSLLLRPLKDLIWTFPTGQLKKTNAALLEMLLTGVLQKKEKATIESGILILVKN